MHHTDIMISSFIVFGISAVVHLGIEFKYRNYFGKWGTQSHFSCIRALIKDKPVPGWSMLASFVVMLGNLIGMFVIKFGHGLEP